MNELNPLLVHIPHASIEIPTEAQSQFRATNEAIEQELLALTDWYTDDLFSVSPAQGTAIRFPVSRLVVDPERFENDADEAMAARGMGVIYTHFSNATPYRTQLSMEAREALLATWYRPHWSKVESIVDAILDVHDRCLIIDAHSFGDRPLPVHQAQYGDAPTADICLGTDQFHTPKELVDVATAAFEQCGLSVSVDTPFAGTIVPLKHLNADDRVRSIMIEVNRRIYMDESTGAKSLQYQDTKSAVQSVIATLGDFTP
jgi:N-formylglutamate deformylase